MQKATTLLLSIGALSLGSATAQAAFVPYTDIPTFEAAIASAGLTTRTVDFGTDTQSIPSGGTYDGLTFTYSTLVGAATSLEIFGAPPTPLTDSVLGTDYTPNGGQFVDGDSIGISFAPSRVFGIVFQTTFDSIANTDFFITIGSTDYFIDTNDGFVIDPIADPQILGYFVGGYDTTSAFTQVQVNSASFGGGTLTYFNDDIVVSAVPAPTTLALLSFGIGLIGFRKSRRDRQS